VKINTKSTVPVGNPRSKRPSVKQGGRTPPAQAARPDLGFLEPFFFASWRLGVKLFANPNPLRAGAGFESPQPIGFHVGSPLHSSRARAPWNRVGGAVWFGGDSWGGAVSLRSVRQEAKPGRDSPRGFSPAYEATS
jgi:hypothetical protein